MIKSALPIAVMLDIIVLAAATPSPAHAVDHEVEIRCEDSCAVTLSPDPIVLVAGRDRVRWRMPGECWQSRCAEFREAVSVVICMAPYPTDCLSLGWGTLETAFRGPFSGTGTLQYFIHGWSSHGVYVFSRHGEIQIQAPSATHAAEWSQVKRLFR